MSNHRFNIHTTDTDQPQEFLHVPLFCPADVADGVIDALLFVVWIISAGAVRPRDPKIQLLFIINVTGDVQTNVSYSGNSPFVSTDPSGKLNRLIALGGGGDDYCVQTTAIGERFSYFLYVILSDDSSL